MYQLWYVDAVCKIPPWAGYERKKNYRLLSQLRQENDSNAYVRKLHIWEWRMERRWHLLCLPRTGVDTRKTTQTSWQRKVKPELRKDGRRIKGRCRRRMIKENGKIKEISENEAFCMFIDNEYYMAMDFYEFRSRLEETGAKITKS